MRLPLAVALVAAAITFQGCGGAESDPGRGPYYDELRDAGRTATSDFEREALEDGELTRAEYEEAVQRFVGCAADRGVELTAKRQGALYIYQMRTDAENDAVAAECSVGTTQLIEALYGDLVANPANGDFDQLVVDCLVRSGLAPSDYTKERFLAERDGNLPFSEGDPRMQECFGNVEAY